MKKILLSTLLVSGILFNATKVDAAFDLSKFKDLAKNLPNLSALNWQKIGWGSAMCATAINLAWNLKDINNKVIKSTEIRKSKSSKEKNIIYVKAGLILAVNVLAIGLLAEKLKN